MNSPRSAYVHVPFCSHRCGYCNFTLVAGRDDLMDSYLRALELELSCTLVTPREVETLFVGGGTPTHLPPEFLRKLLKLLSDWLPLCEGYEFSCEANPLDCTDERLEILASAAVNRMSLGGQSFSDRKLRALERDHRGTQLQETLVRCSRWFPNLSLDLIFAAPDESLDEWQRDLRLALESPIEHLSTYGLTVERGSAFYGRALRNDITELDADLQLAMFEHGISTLGDAGWEHYEVSSFAKPGKQCRHNQAYWLGEPWWGFGPGAASFLPDSSSNMIRAINHQSTTQYIRKTLAGHSPVSERVLLTLEERVRERLVFGLRQMSGVSMTELDRMWGGEARPLFEPFLSSYLDQNYLDESGERLRLTRNGLMISDSLWPNLLN